MVVVLELLDDDRDEPPVLFAGGMHFPVQTSPQPTMMIQTITITPVATLSTAILPAPTAPGGSW